MAFNVLGAQGKASGQDTVLTLEDASGRGWHIETDNTNQKLLVKHGATTVAAFDGASSNMLFADSQSIIFGTGSDVDMRWDGTDFDILPAVDDSVLKFGNGTLSFDIWIYGATSSDTFVFDASAKTLTLDGIDLRLDDADFLEFGDAQDITMAWDGTDFDILQATADSSFKWGIDGAGIDQVWYGDTAGSNMTWDQSADSLIFTDSTLLVFGDSSDASIQFDATNLLITPLGVGGAVIIGDAADTEGNTLHLFDGGAEKPGAIAFYSGEATGVIYYLWADSTGDLRIHTGYPTDENMDGTVVGAQS